MNYQKKYKTIGDIDDKLGRKCKNLGRDMG